MKYIIHSSVIFDTTEYLLTLLTDTDTSIKLSNSAGRILEELIKYRNNDEPITREHLFSTAWRAHGLEPSHGNLNQQISLIRKSLSLLGIEPGSIITIPKRGLKLNKKIAIKVMDDNSFSIQPPKMTNNKELCNKISSFSNPTILKTNPRYTIILLILIITALSASIIYFYIKDRNLKKLYLCKQINSCNICTFHQTPNLECNDLSFKVPEKTQKNTENYTNNNNNNCTKIFLKNPDIPHKQQDNICV